MNITLKLDAELIQKVKKIALDKNTTLTQMVRDFLTTIARQDDAQRKRSFQKFTKAVHQYQRPINLQPRAWSRDEIHER